MKTNKPVKAWAAYDIVHGEGLAEAGCYIIGRTKFAVESHKEFVPEWDKAVRVLITPIKQNI